MELQERIRAIARCCDEIEISVRNQAPEDFGALLGEMDWRSELHRLLFEEE